MRDRVQNPVIKLEMYLETIEYYRTYPKLLVLPQQKRNTRTLESGTKQFWVNTDGSWKLQRRASEQSVAG